MKVIPDGEALFAGRSARTIVKDARELLADIDRWTNSFVAIDQYGRTVKPLDPTAIRWSVEGALAKCSNDWGLAPPSLLIFLDELAVAEFDLEPDMPLWMVADLVFDHDTVLAFLDRAAELLPDI